MAGFTDIVSSGVFVWISNHFLRRIARTFRVNGRENCLLGMKIKKAIIMEN